MQKFCARWGLWSGLLSLTQAAVDVVEVSEGGDHHEQVQPRHGPGGRLVVQPEIIKNININKD